jgi:V8-like Glu-specific endopeptidase
LRQQRLLGVTGLVIGAALIVVGCGGNEATEAKKPSAPASAVATGKSELSIPNQFAGGVDAYWEQASQSAIPYDLREPDKSQAPEDQIAPESPETVVSPGKGNGSKVKLGQGGGELKSATQKAQGRWKGTTKGPFATTEGKIFFDEGKGHYVCSGTVLNSPNESVVWTAGHCVHSGAPPTVKVNGRWKRHFHKNWVFAPGYLNGRAPYGFWRPANNQITTLTNWAKYGSLLYDLGAVVLQKKKGRTVVEVAKGGQGISFNRAADLTYWSFGYPAAPPFNGANLFYCNSGLVARDWPSKIRAWKGELYRAPVKIGGPARIAIRCNMTGGSSGGGWMASFTQVWGYVTGVNSTGDDKTMYSPYLGDAAAALWTAVKDS